MSCLSKNVYAVYGKLVSPGSFYLTGVYIFVLCILLLWPFNLHFLGLVPEVTWLSPNNGVEVVSVTALRSRLLPKKFFTALRSRLLPKKFYEGLVNGAGLTVEAWVASRNVEQQGPARIVSYSFDPLLRNFTLGQDGRTLVMRLRTTKTNLNGTQPEMRVPDVFISNTPQHLVVTYDYVRERVYINGRRRAEKVGPGGTFANWDRSFPFLLGNEATGNRPWLGKIFLVAIYNRALSVTEVEQNFHAGRMMGPDIQPASNRVTNGLIMMYSFLAGRGSVVVDRSGMTPHVDLHVISKPVITRKAFLEGIPQKWNNNFDFLLDVIGNIAVFSPLGFLFYFPLKKRTSSSLRVVVWASAIGMIFSLSIEMLQYFSVSRYSSFVDVGANTVGTILGSLLAHIAFNQFLNWERDEAHGY